METVRITRNYQMVIPASIRKAVGIREGDLVRVWYDEKEGVIKVKKVDPLEEIEQELKSLPGAKFDWKELKKYVYEMFD
ncbi:MAG: AbrB/MazE/SpoVT family DNA-binding domain-containing protein [Thermoproteus sp.]